MKKRKHENNKNTHKNETNKNKQKYLQKKGNKLIQTKNNE